MGATLSKTWAGPTGRDGPLGGEAPRGAVLAKTVPLIPRREQARYVPSCSRQCRFAQDTRGYFCATVGQVTEEMIKQYLEHHFEPNPEVKWVGEGQE